MKYLKILNKIIIFLLYFFALVGLVYLIYYINSQDPFKKHVRRNIKSIFQNSTLTNHLLNDYQEKFLPNTQFIKLNYKKIKLDFLTKNQCYNSTCYGFYIDKFQDNLIILDKNGKNLRYTKFNSLKKEKPKFNNISSNINFTNILDVFVKDDDIFISGVKIHNNESYLEIVKGKFNTKKINFENVAKLQDKKCFFVHSIHSGKIQSFKNINNKLILSINSSGNRDDPGPENLSPDSICGKTLLIDTDTGKYEIYTSGHRNILGLYSDENVVIATENGPFSGDEINNLKKNKSYGWSIASYGEKYSRNQNNKEEAYKKEHEKFGFTEPIFSFMPALGISEIIKLPNTFSDLWKDNFLVGSLNGKHLLRVKFNNKFNKIIYFEKIFIGDRIRDLLYYNESDEIILALELTGSLGIISNPN